MDRKGAAELKKHPVHQVMRGCSPPKQDAKLPEIGY